MPQTTPAELKYLVERQREEIKTVNDVGRLLSSTSDPQGIIRLVASYLKQTFPVALCGILILEQRKLQLIQFAKIAQVDLAAAIREIAAKASEHLRQPLNAEEMAQSLEDQSGGAGQWAQAPISYLRSNHSVPLQVNSQAIGVLSVFSGKAEAFSKEERHVIDIVADQLGAGLRNAFLVDELKRAGQLKNDLLMVISHELRIPITSLREGLSLILDGSLGPTTTDQQAFLTEVTRNADRLARLIEKVVLAIQLVTSQLEYAVQEMDLGILLREVAALFRPFSQATQVSLELAGVAQAAPFRGDAKRLKEAVVQLVENGIQATPSGGRVTLRCTASPSQVEIHVSDTGSGIPPEELPKRFDQFRFIGGIDNRKTGGLGLGLFIAHTIVTAHGGTLALESQVGQGTQVVVRLPKQNLPTTSS